MNRAHLDQRITNINWKVTKKKGQKIAEIGSKKSENQTTVQTENKPQSEAKNRSRSVLEQNTNWLK